MLKEELMKTSQEKITEKQVRKENMHYKFNKIINMFPCSQIRLLISKYEQIKHQRYDKKTKFIIKRLPQKLLKSAKKGQSYVDVHTYYYKSIINPFYYESTAHLYLDNRGKDIIKFLDKEGLNYTLVAHNHVAESYYTIRVIFDNCR